MCEYSLGLATSDHLKHESGCRDSVHEDRNEHFLGSGSVSGIYVRPVVVIMSLLQRAFAGLLHTSVSRCAGAEVAHHSWPLPQAHALHAVCWAMEDGATRVALSAVVARAPPHAGAQAPLSEYRVHAVPCANVGTVSAVAANHGFAVVGSAEGAVAAWLCDSGSGAPVCVGGWSLDGQAMSALALAVLESGLQVLVAMESGDVYNFDTGLG